MQTKDHSYFQNNNNENGRSEIRKIRAPGPGCSDVFEFYDRVF